MATEQHPLILVFYLKRELMANKDIIGPYADFIDKTLSDRDANAMAFFMPTDGEEWIDCINPVEVKKTDMKKIMKTLDEIKESFQLDDKKDEE